MRRWTLSRMVAVFGVLAFAFAVLSIVDILVPRPYDGVVLEADQWGTLSVREVVPGSGADLAGILPADRIVGIDRTLLQSSAHAGRILARREIGDEVPYLLRRGEGVEEVRGVRLGRRFIGSATYFFACLLGFAFFVVTLFVLRRQPELRAAQIFHLVGALFLLFLVCRLRPASYGWIDGLVLEAGAVALLLLPACFLHFFLVFPRPIALRPAAGDPDFVRRRRRWLTLLVTLYLLPLTVFVTALVLWQRAGVEPRLITGAPEVSWWVLGLYMLVGLATLAWNARQTRDPRQRRGIALVFAGSLFGLLPFLALAVARPAWLHTEPQAFALLGPLALVPLTFAFAIIRFGLLDIRVMVRRSLVYSIVTVGIAAVYAAALALVNTFALGSELSATRTFPILFALGVLLLLEPLRHRAQGMIDAFVHADRRRLEEAIRKLGRAVAAELDPQPVVRDVVERLPQILGLHFAALYLEKEGALERAAGPEQLPASLPLLAPLHDALAAKGEPVPLAELARLVPGSEEVRQLVARLEPAGVEIVGDLTSPRRKIGLVLLSGTTGQIEIGDEVRALLGNLFGQAALALETSRLVAERTRQAELERELEIASSVQTAASAARPPFRRRLVGGGGLPRRAPRRRRFLHRAAGRKERQSRHRLRRRGGEVGRRRPGDDGGARGAPDPGALPPRPRDPVRAGQPQALRSRHEEVVRGARLGGGLRRRRGDRLPPRRASRSSWCARARAPCASCRCHRIACRSGRSSTAATWRAVRWWLPAISCSATRTASPKRRPRTASSSAKSGWCRSSARPGGAARDHRAGPRRRSRSSPAAPILMTTSLSSPSRGTEEEKHATSHTDHRAGHGRGGRGGALGALAAREALRRLDDEVARGSGRPSRPGSTRGCASTSSTPQRASAGRSSSTRSSRRPGCSSPRSRPTARSASACARSSRPSTSRASTSASVSWSNWRACRASSRRRSAPAISRAIPRIRGRCTSPLARPGTARTGSLPPSSTPASSGSTRTGRWRATTWATWRWPGRSSPRRRSSFARTPTWHPTRPIRTTRWASSSLSLGRYDEARAELERALAIRPDFCASYQHLAGIAVFEGKPEEIPPLAERLGEHCPAEMQAALECEARFFAAFISRDFDAPWRDGFATCGGKMGGAGILIHRLALLAGRQAEADREEAALAKAVEESSKAGYPKGRARVVQVEALHNQGVRKLGEGDPRAAADLFRAADDRASYWGVDEGRMKLFNKLNLALALDRAGEAQEAEAVLESVRAVNPAFARTYPELSSRTPGKS